jgi:hypothetical protein
VLLFGTFGKLLYLTKLSQPLTASLIIGIRLSAFSVG